LVSVQIFRKVCKVKDIAIFDRESTQLSVYMIKVQLLGTL